MDLEETGASAGRGMLEVNARHKALGRMLQRDRESAWQIAHYERGQRDEYTSKLRFGLAALNAASMVTVLNIGGVMGGVGTGSILLSAAAFFVGTILAGYSLVAHQTHLIELTGATITKARTLDIAVSLSEFPPGSAENRQLDKALGAIKEQEGQQHTYSDSAITCQAWSSAAWIGGAGTLGLVKAFSLSPTLGEVASWVGIGC